MNRVTCAECGKLWQESCVECAEETATRHSRATGHQVELAVIQEKPDIGVLMGLTRQAHRFLYEGRR